MHFILYASVLDNEGSRDLIQDSWTLVLKCLTLLTMRSETARGRAGEGGSDRVSLPWSRANEQCEDSHFEKTQIKKKERKQKPVCRRTI